MREKPTIWVKQDPEKKNVFWPSKALKSKAWVSEDSIYQKASKDPVSWWAKLAKEG